MKSKFKYPFYKALGLVFLALAIVGIPLPVLPTTPFLLLSAWFFARSSDKWHAWLLKSELFGLMIRNWETSRCITLRTKIVAILGMASVGGSSVVFGINDDRIAAVAVIIMLVGAVVVLNIPTCSKRHPIVHECKRGGDCDRDIREPPKSTPFDPDQVANTGSTPHS